MTRDEIIELAREAGFRAGRIKLGNSDPLPFVAPCSAMDCLPELERFAELVAAPGVPECPYPCGWQNLLKHAIEDGAYLARQINEDEPVTENARAVTMRMVMRLRDVLLVMNSAAPEAKP